MINRVEANALLDRRVFSLGRRLVTRSRMLVVPDISAVASEPSKGLPVKAASYVISELSNEPGLVSHSRLRLADTSKTSSNNSFGSAWSVE